MNQNKCVVYTVLTGYKENLRNPFPNDSFGYERICFTDNPELQSKDWSIVLIDNHSLKAERESRRPKLLPHHFLSDFEHSLYIDNTIDFKVDPLDIFKKYINSQSSLVCFNHPWRDCIYDEGEVVIHSGLEDECRVREQLDFYQLQGFPKHQGLIAGTILLRKHLDTKLIELTEEWFNHVLRFSKRDQLSFPFVAWHRNFKYSLFNGSLISNPIIEWLAPKGTIPRLPPGFKDEIYSWLNPEVTTSHMSPRQHYLEIGAYKKLPYRKYIWELEVIANKYKTDKGSLYYNCHGYASIYQKYLSKYKDSNINLLELGLLRHDVQKRNPGGPYDDAPSLKMWREYFPHAFIVGFDIADFSKCLPLENVKIIRGDMGKISDLQILVQENPSKFDVIIDDASHASHHQQIALGYLFKHLREGGFYIIEDLHYQPCEIEYPGITTTKEILKSLENGIINDTQFLKIETLKDIQENIEFIHFYDSQDRQFGEIYSDAIVIIKKKNKVSNQEHEHQDTISSYLKQLNRQTVRIDLGCGANKSVGFIGVDICNDPSVDIVADLNKKFPLPDSSVDELKAHDIIEHLQDRIHTMNEIWRVCKPGAKVDIRVPSTDGRGAFQDPTHVSFWNINSFLYYCSEFPVYLQLCRKYGFKGEFNIVQLEQEESPGNVIHVIAELRVVKPISDISENQINVNAKVFHQYQQIIEENGYLKFLFSPKPYFLEIDEADNYSEYLQKSLDYLHASTFSNSDSDLWNQIVEHFAQNVNFIQAYFNEINLKNIYVKRAEIIEYLLKLKGQEINYEFTDTPVNRKKIRLGILAAHFTPSAETFAYLPVYEYISRDFEVILYSLIETGHRLEQYCQLSANSFKLLPQNLSEQINTIRSDDLDILFIATNVTAVTNQICLLAIHRLARIQVTSGGSVVTTGMRNVDYYISGTLTDPSPTAQDHYQEKLIKLEGTAHCFSYGTEEGKLTTPVERNSLGVPEDAVVFISGANYFKTVPELMGTWAKIISKVSNSVLVLLPFGLNWSNNYPKIEFIHHLKSIFSKHGLATERLIVLDPQPVPDREDMKEYYKIADVYLDSYPFAGTTSLIEPLQVNLPVIARQGNCFRSAMGAAIIQTLDIPNLVADSEESYIELAVALGTNSELRREKSVQIKEKMQSNPSFLDSRSYSAKIGNLFQELFSNYMADTLSQNLRLGDINLIIFPDWLQPEELISSELEQVIKAVATHPNSEKTTLLININNVAVEDVELLLSAVAMNLLMEEDLDVTEGLEISLVESLSDIQWQALLPRIHARIALQYENQDALIQAKAETLLTYNLESLSQAQEKDSFCLS
ncbi:putative O-linked N-acetylglucosamine transferase, SPINDLY family [Nostoc sp. PCC 7524]|uniref:O-linked N-acetylglucosamine transferase family protein n=1 Tax=Nostoc sp. (strain ATCC 29411 / PCC 7524) TaxID=28072 RepID=UPI00029EE133|nr:glycosyltransferase domain-containing protein [Nostoc sp. PCC 7524]AFY50919.1 putative O-linked N-acetylglucosamine transferase, SPINDLY family [Nostoc sp. PCC 7524]